MPKTKTSNSKTSKSINTIKLIIDNRERGLIHNLNVKEINHIVKQLDLGDIIIELDNDLKEELFIIERKTVRDLLSSVGDGRYKEQKMRLSAMKQKGECREIFYLIEGDLNIGLSPDEIKTFHGAIISMQFRDKINVIRTMDISETVNFIVRLIDRCKLGNCWSDSDGSSQSGSGVSSEDHYLNNIKRKKGSNISRDGCQLLVISSVPGVSIDTAKEIIKKYGSVKGLFDAYLRLGDNNVEKEKMLVGIDLKKGKISENMSKKIFELLY